MAHPKNTIETAAWGYDFDPDTTVMKRNMVRHDELGLVEATTGCAKSILKLGGALGIAALAIKAPRFTAGAAAAAAAVIGAAKLATKEDDTEGDYEL